MDETKDQVQTDSPVVAEAPKGPKVIKKDQAPKEQSETTEVKEDVKASKTYKTPDGRELSSDEIYEEYNKLSPEFTRRSQELAEYKRRDTEAQERNKRTAEESVSQSKLLEDVDPSVKAAIIELVKGPINEALQARDREIEKKLSQDRFDQRLGELGKKYPKFDKQEILREMQKPTNEIYDPEVLYQKLHWDSFLDDQIKAAMKGKSGGSSTESTSTEAPRKPGEVKNPTTWAEASRNAVSRF